MFGTNPKRPPLKNHDGLSLDVVEIFPTIQGEGPFSGMPAIFIRLGGCNLACDFCDTEFEKFEPIALEEVVDAAVSLSPTPLTESLKLSTPLPPQLLPLQLTESLKLPTPLAGGARGGHSHSEIGYYGKQSNSTRKQQAQVRAQSLKENPTEAEKKFWSQALAKSHLGVKFRRQQPIGNYIVDFVCMDKKLIIELDGGQHNEPSERQKDNIRTAFLEQQGYRVIRFWNHEVIDNLEGVVDVIYNYIDEVRLDRCPPLAPPASGVGKESVSASGVGKKDNKLLVVITGGEPMRQNLSPLCSALIECGFGVQIETNGTLYQDLPEAVSIVCSPKNTGSGYAPIRPDLLARVDALKFITSKTHANYQGVADWCSEATDLPDIYVQPMDEQDSAMNKENTAYTIALAKQHGYRLSLQLHKILDIP